MSESSKHNSYGRARLDDRQVTELIGIARGVIADDFLNDSEIDFMCKWLVANEGITGNPVVGLMEQRLSEVLEDDIVDEDERYDLFQLLKKFVSNDFEVGEVLRASVLPLCTPPPHIEFSGISFCFTGTFVFGSRRECAEAVTNRGGFEGNLTLSTNFLVIGEYATDSWAQSSFGRKIEKAVQMREKDSGIRIISEPHWRTSLW